MKKILTLLVLIMAFASCEETELQPNVDFIYFYNWDMTTENSLTINNSIKPEKIIKSEVIIYTDFGDTGGFKFELNNLTLDKNSSLVIEPNKFTINISENGFFDTETFNNNEQRRGHVRIEYY